MKVGDLVKLKVGMSIDRYGIILNKCRDQRQTTFDIAMSDGTVLRRIWEKHLEASSENL
jgi:hypothetical protein